MFIFTRRAIQTMLDDIATWMPHKPLDDLVSRLNTPKSNRLPQMWEVAWLYALGGVVEIEHEKPLTNGNPDLWLTVSTGDKNVQIIGDITTLSDVKLHETNPFEKLSSAVQEHARKSGLINGGFDIRVNNTEFKNLRGSKVQLLIPTGPEFEQLVKKHIKPFAKAVAERPTETHLLEINEPKASFTVKYKGQNQYSMGSYRSYDLALSRENNVLYNRLNDKTRQLRGAPEGAVRMVIICDGDCSLLGREGSSSQGFSAQHITENFLNRSQTIDLVLLVTIKEERWSIIRSPQKKEVECNLIFSRQKRPSHLTDSTLQTIFQVFEAATKRLPKPDLMPNNALRRNLDSDWSNSMEGAMKLDQAKIMVSARAVLELLAGTMSYDRFAQLHRFTQEQQNIFKHRLSSGQLIRSARVERLDSSEDDDWLVFEFGPPDPAISEFKVNRRS